MQPRSLLTLGFHGIFKVENSDSLRLKSNSAEVRASVECLRIDQKIIILSLPLNFSVEHLLNVHVASQCPLFDVNAVIHWC
jgi:hypothetical protein